MVFHSYVSLPEGKPYNQLCLSSLLRPPVRPLGLPQRSRWQGNCAHHQLCHGRKIDGLPSPVPIWVFFFNGFFNTPRILKIVSGCDSHLSGLVLRWCHSLDQTWSKWIQMGHFTTGSEFSMHSIAQLKGGLAGLLEQWLQRRPSCADWRPHRRTGPEIFSPVVFLMIKNYRVSYWAHAGTLDR